MCNCVIVLLSSCFLRECRITVLHNTGTLERGMYVANRDASVP